MNPVGSGQGQRVDLLGLPIDALDMDATVERVARLIEARKPTQHVVMNAAKYVTAWRNAELTEIISSCSLISADGQSVVWASRLLGRPLPTRVAGIDLFERLIGECASHGWRCFFLGAQPEVVQRVVEHLTERYPDLRVAGARDGYWEDDRVVVGEVREARADVLFVALPSPRKERWLSKYLEELAVPFVMGVGGTFDVVAGVTSRAPLWAQRAGLEWVYRLLQEPKRMFKRYLLGNSLFVYGVLRAAITRRPEANPLMR